jgi:phosphoglycerate dehydrogenase-like enzyme
MKKRMQLVVNVTRDRRVHDILEQTIAVDRSVSTMFDRKYVMSRDELLASIESAEVLFTFAVSDGIISCAHSLKWVHFASAGVEKSLSPALKAKKIKVTCSRGIHGSTIAEYVMMQILAFSKNLSRALEFQSAHLWRFEELLSGKFDLEGKTVAIVGLGSIGRRIAGLARAFGMRVVGTVSKPRKIRHVDRVFGPSHLNDCIGQADFVILSVPLTERTHHIIDKERLGIMKESAFLVNVGRGKLVDETALIEALRSKRIAGAALDVFEIEPLPSESPLWEMDNVSVTPHYSGMAENLWEKVGRLFCENAIRFKNGRKLLGIVNLDEGY